MEHQDSKHDIRYYYGQISRLPTLTNYADALAHYNKIKPLRGSYPPLRPICIGYRHKKAYTIEHPFADVVTCYLDENPVLQFRKDGTIEVQVSDSFRTMRACDFISHILDTTAQVVKGVVHICLDGEKQLVVPEVEPNTIGYGTTLILRGKWRPLDLAERDRRESYYMDSWCCKGIWSDVEQLNDTTPMVLRVNKEVAKEVRRAIKPFTDDCIRIAKLMNFDGEVLTQNVNYSSSFELSPVNLGQCSVEELKQALDERREKLIPIIYDYARSYTYGVATARTGGHGGVELSAKSIRATVLEMAKYSHKDYFKEVPSTPGKLVIDINRKYWGNV
jgi:hypothetical protein